MKLKSHGFTLIEIMVVLAIIGIVASMALPAYQRYTIRAQVAEGLSLAGPLQRGLTAYYNNDGNYPVDNSDAALLPPGNYAGRYVDSISISGPVISITYGNQASAIISGNTVELTAIGSNGSLSWQCRTGGVIATSHLPSICR